MITDGRGDTSQQGTHFGASLGESEDVVNEKKHIFSFFVSEVFGNSKSGKSDSGSSSWGFVHLSVDEGTSGTGAIDLDNSRGNHFVVKVISFSGSFTDTGEYRVTSMSLCNVVNKFLNKHGFSDTGSSEESNLSSSSVRGEEINDFDTGDQEFGSGTLVFE